MRFFLISSSYRTSVFRGLLVHERMCSLVSVVSIANFGDSASIIIFLDVGRTPLYLRTRNIGHVLKKAMVLSMTEKNNVKINLRS